VYARVSTHEQTCGNQLLELRRYVEARGWTATEYVDTGVSGAKDRRPALDQLTTAVRRHQVDAVVCWRLDRLGRNLRHLVLLLDEWQSRGIAFVTLGEGIDTSTAAGRLVAGVLGSIAEFERARLQERIRAGLSRANAEGTRLGRRRSRLREAWTPASGCPMRPLQQGSKCQWRASNAGAAFGAQSEKPPARSLDVQENG
jgi:DNA invertase Pin-like site-specific DNA recombinase